MVLAKSDVSSSEKSSGEPHSLKNDGTDLFNEFSYVVLPPKIANGVALCSARVAPKLGVGKRICGVDGLNC